MTAILLSDLVWEGTSGDMADDLPGLRDGHFFKQLDTGESYFRRNGVWEFVNLGLAFIKATKSGNVTTDSGGVGTVTFHTPFIDNLYSVSLTCQDPGIGPGVIAYVVSKATTGFSVISRRPTSGQPVPNVTLSWLATRDYDP